MHAADRTSGGLLNRGKPPGRVTPFGDKRGPVQVKTFRSINHVPLTILSLLVIEPLD